MVLPLDLLTDLLYDIACTRSIDNHCTYQRLGLETIAIDALLDLETAGKRVGSKLL
jgi:hypothetical protein